MKGQHLEVSKLWGLETGSRTPGSVQALFLMGWALGQASTMGPQLPHHRGQRSTTVLVQPRSAFKCGEGQWGCPGRKQGEECGDQGLVFTLSVKSFLPNSEVL